jgi:Arc/MetJ-type ribon-helix-helix transcriptional regulator
MKNSLVSIRIPKALVEELKKASQKDHFLDLSETVRSIVRDRWIQTQDPSSYHLQQIKKEIHDGLKARSSDQIIKELENIKNMLLK